MCSIFVVSFIKLSLTELWHTVTVFKRASSPALMSALPAVKLTPLSAGSTQTTPVGSLSSPEVCHYLVTIRY